jgi:hypothetical protein
LLKLNKHTAMKRLLLIHRFFTLLFSFCFIASSFTQPGNIGTVTAINSAGTVSSVPLLTLSGGPNTCSDVGNLRSGRVQVRNLSGATNDNNRSSQSCFEIGSSGTTNKNMWVRIAVPAGSGITGLYFYGTTSGVTPQPASGSTDVRSAMLGLYSGTATSSACTPALICGSRWTNVICSYASSLPILRPAATERVDVTPGTTYMLEIWTTSFSTNANYNFDFFVVPLGANPSNNNCANSILFTNQVGCNLGAHPSCLVDDPNCAFTIENSVFYTITKPDAGAFSVTISNVSCDGGANSLQVGIYRANTTNCATNLNVTGSQLTLPSSQTCFTGTSTIPISNADPPGTQYIIWFDGNAGAACTWGITVLPVEWDYFEAENIDDTNYILWETASETNSYYFEVERSNNTEDWVTLDKLGGAGTSSIRNSYRYNDEKPMVGFNYYRIKQVDYDGKYSYSDIRAVEYNGNDESRFVPNPNNGTFTISKLEKNTLIEIYAPTGQLIYNSICENPSEMIELNSTLKGVYFVKLNGEFKGKFVIQ